jgi:hypothetical protein
MTNAKILYFFVLIILYLGSEFSLSSEEAVLYQLALCACISLYPLVFDRSMPVVSNPIFWCTALYFVYYAQGAYQSLFTDNTMLFGTPKEYIATQLVFINWCTGLFLIGYYLNLGGGTTKLRYELATQKIGMIIPYAGLLVVLGLIYQVYSGKYFHGTDNAIGSFEEGYGEQGITLFTQIFIYLADLKILLLVLSGYLCWVQKRKGAFWVFVGIVAAITLYEIPSGSKERVLSPTFFALVVYSVFTKKTPYIFLGVTFLVALLVVFPFYGIYRLNSSGGLGNAWSDYINSNDISNMAQVSKIAEETGSSRMNAAAIQATIIYQHFANDKPFRYGEDYFQIGIAIIPRFIWPDKPAITSGNQFGYEYGIIGFDDDRTSVGRYWQGEAFINFGWLGCLMGFFYGLFLRFLKNLLYRDNSLFGIFLFLIIGFGWLRMDQFVPFLNDTIKQTLFYLAIFYPFSQRLAASPAKAFHTIR